MEHMFGADWCYVFCYFFWALPRESSFSFLLQMAGLYLYLTSLSQSLFYILISVLGVRALLGWFGAGWVQVGFL